MVLSYRKEIDVFERARQGEPAPVRQDNTNPRNIQEFNELKYKSKNQNFTTYGFIIELFLKLICNRCQFWMFHDLCCFSVLANKENTWYL